MTRRNIVLGLLGCLLLGAGGIGIRNYLVITQTPYDLNKALAAPPLTNSVEHPSESVPSGALPASLPPDLPVTLTMPTLGINAPVQRVAVGRDGTITAPDNIHVAGWFTGSVIPGSVGLSIIDGHVSGTYQDGVFKHLTNLVPGDTAEITFGDRSLKKFQVVKTTSLPLEEADKMLYEQRADVVSQLNLITCDGKYDKTRNTYDRRAIVVLRLISN